MFIILQNRVFQESRDNIKAENVSYLKINHLRYMPKKKTVRAFLSVFINFYPFAERSNNSNYLCNYKTEIY